VPSTRRTSPTRRCSCWPRSSADPTCWTPSNATSPTTLDLIRPDGTVETVHSRRQDQKRSFPLCALPAALPAARDPHRPGRLRPRGPPGGRRRHRRPRPARPDPPHPGPVPRPAGPGPEKLPRDRYLDHRTPRLTRLGHRAHRGVRRLGRARAPAHPLGPRLQPHLPAPVRRCRRPRRGPPLAGFFDLGPFRAADMEQLADNRYRLTQTLTPPTTSRSRRTGGADDGAYAWWTRDASPRRWPSPTALRTRSPTRPGSRSTCAMTEPTCGSTSAAHRCPGPSN
jgi:hypothetical protein